MTGVSIHYDRDADLLSLLRKGRKIWKSVSLGDVTLDFGPDGAVVGVEVLNASRSVLFADEDVDGVDALASVQDASIEVEKRGSSVFVVVRLYRDGDRVEEVAHMTQGAPAVSA